MTFDCRQLDDVLREADPGALDAARVHGRGCASCREQLEAWDAVSQGAPWLGREWESPALWLRIEGALARETAWRHARRRMVRWLPAAAVAAGLIAASTTWLVLRRPVARDAATVGQRLLTEHALQDVERSEAQYAASIDRLAKVAGPLIEKPDTPLLASYREKLQLLDAAIADCRAEIEGNRFNAQLRRELLSIYQEKQRTLEQLMGERT